MKVRFAMEDLKHLVALMETAAGRVKFSEQKKKFARLRVETDETTGEPVARVITGEFVTIEHVAFLEEGDPGEVAVPLDVLKAVASAPPGPDAVVRTPQNFNGVEVTSGPKFKSKVATPDLGFLTPFLADADLTVSFPNSLQFRGLLARIESAIFTESAERTQYAARIMDGAAFVSRGGVLRVYSTDNNRISRAEIPCSTEFEMVLSKDTVTALLGVLKIEDGPVALALTGGVARFTVGRTKVECHLLNAQLPGAADSMFEMGWPNAALVKPGELKAALGRVKTMTDDNALEFAFGDGGLHITATKRLGQAGVAEDEVEAEITGEPGRIRINRGYVEDAIRGANEVSVRYGGEDMPTVLVEHPGCEYHTRHAIALMR